MKTRTHFTFLIFSLISLNVYPWGNWVWQFKPKNEVQARVTVEKKFGTGCRKAKKKLKGNVKKFCKKHELDCVHHETKIIEKFVGRAYRRVWLPGTCTIEAIYKY